MTDTGNSAGWGSNSHSEYSRIGVPDSLRVKVEPQPAEQVGNSVEYYGSHEAYMATRKPLKRSFWKRMLEWLGL